MTGSIGEAVAVARTACGASTVAPGVSKLLLRCGQILSRAESKHLLNSGSRRRGGSPTYACAPARPPLLRREAYVTRAGAGKAGERALGHLRAGNNSVRDALGAAGVREGFFGRHDAAILKEEPSELAGEGKKIAPGVVLERRKVRRFAYLRPVTRSIAVYSAGRPSAFGTKASAPTVRQANKYVLIRGSAELDWANSHKMRNIDDLRKAKTGGGPDIVLCGSSTLYPPLLEANLIDRLLLFTCPMFLGKGKKLFGSMSHPVTLKLVRSDISSTGVINRDLRAGGLIADEWPTLRSERHLTK